MKIILLFLVSTFFVYNAWAQTEEQIVDRFKESKKILIESIPYFNNAMECWKPKNADYVCGMENLLKFEEIISPLIRGNPLLDYDIIKLDANTFKDMARRYVRFMINCSANQPKICEKYDCLNKGWQMTEDIKSLNLRYDVIKKEADKLNQDQKNILFKLNYNQPDSRLTLSQILPAARFLYQNNTNVYSFSNSLNANEVFISFFMTDNRRPVYAWVLRKNQQPKVLSLGINTAELFFRIEMVKAEMAGDTTWKQVLDYLLQYEDSDLVDGRKPYPPLSKHPLTTQGSLDAFSAKVVGALGIKPGEKIIISPDQNIASLPFNAVKFPSSKNYLYQLSKICFVPSARFYSYLLDGHKVMAQEFELSQFYGFAFGENLINTIDEVENAKKHFENANIFIEKNFNETNFNNAFLNKVKASDAVLHIASHSAIVEDRFGVQYNGILCHPDANNDGIILSENFQNVPKNVRLIVLSGCDIAPSSDVKDYFNRMSEIMNEKADNNIEINELITLAGGSACICSYGETFSSLISASISRRPSKILASQWNINDASTSEFFDIFYDNLYKNGDIWIAHRNAMDAMNHLDIKYWAPFIIIGL